MLQEIKRPVPLKAQSSPGCSYIQLCIKHASGVGEYRVHGSCTVLGNSRNQVEPSDIK